MAENTPDIARRRYNPEAAAKTIARRTETEEFKKLAAADAAAREAAARAQEEEEREVEQARERQAALQDAALEREREALETADIPAPQKGTGADASAITVRGTSDNAKTEAILAEWEDGVRADADANGGVVPPKSSNTSMFPTVRLNAAPKPVPPPSDTESELNGLISECRFLLHEVAFHSARLTYDPADRIRFLSAAESLARTAATVGDTIGRLRQNGVEPATVHEHRQLVTVEHVQRIASREEGGRGKRRESDHQ